MAMQPISPVAVAVTAHWRTGAPTAVAFEGISRKVTQVLALRREYGVFSASEGRPELLASHGRLVHSGLRRCMGNPAVRVGYR
jgi:hypothetical protein